MSLLVIGSTGTLGRQIVLQALTKGYRVRCLVRNFQNASFLKEWGAELVYGDLTKPETIPPCLKGITAIIDASTNRSEDFNALIQVDWYGKLYLIEAAKAANIKRFVFFSHKKCLETNVRSSIPWMRFKWEIEEKLRESKIPYTIFRFNGFYQGVVKQFAIPILENKQILIPNFNFQVAYIDAQDASKFCLRTFQLPETINETFNLQSTELNSTAEIIDLCAKLAGQIPRTNQGSFWIISLFLFRAFFDWFEWGQAISNRLSFITLYDFKNSKITANIKNLNTKNSVYYIFKIGELEIKKLDDYLAEYFLRLLKKLREINLEDIQKQKDLIV